MAIVQITSIPRVPTPEMPFNEAFDVWIARRVISHSTLSTQSTYISERTEWDYRQYARTLGKSFSATKLCDIGPAAIEEYQRARSFCDGSWAKQAGPNRIRKEVGMLIRILTAARCWSAEHDEDFIPLQLVDPDTRRAMDPDEQYRFLATAYSKPEWLFIYSYTVVSLQSCCSTNELRTLRIGDISLTQGIFQIRSEGAKNKYRIRTIPIQTPEARECWEYLLARAAQLRSTLPHHYLFPYRQTVVSYDPTRPMSDSGLRKRWDEVRSAAELKWLRPYDLRHTAISRLAEAGTSISIIMSLAGHLSVKMQQHYTTICMMAKNSSIADAWGSTNMGDGRWCAQVSLGYKPGGKANRKMLYGKTRHEVSEAMKRVLRDQQMGMTITSERQTLAMFLTDWLENTVKPKNKQLTHRSYSWISQTRLIPSLGRIQLVKLTPQILQAFINERHTAGLSAATVKHINATLRAALSQAQRWQLVHQNAAKLVTLPRSIRYQPTILTPEQSQQLLQHLVGNPNEALFTVALTMGLRRGEVLGLRWSDIDLEKSYLGVRHSLERVKGEGLRLSEPKSQKAKRVLKIPQVCLRSLVKHRVAQHAQREWCGSKWQDGDFIFTTSLGTPMHPDDLTRLFPTVLKAAELPKVRFHDLRHSCASLLLSLGVPAKLVQETVGHSSYQLTMDTYSHMIPALRNEVADRMDEIFPDAVKNAVNVLSEAVN